jgi:LPXTG-site transpeptidase (sortase) family protein
MSRSGDRGAVGPAVALLVVSVLALAGGIAWTQHDADGPVTVDRSASREAIQRVLPSPAGQTSTPSSHPPRHATATRLPRPRLLELPSVSVSMPVVPVGVSSDGQMRMPPDPADVGWYRFGPVPGSSRGSAVLAGHVDSLRYGVGPLARLSALERGDRVTIRTTGPSLTFRVVRVEVITKSDVALRTVFRRGGPGTLRIVTCGPPYIASKGGYQDNVIVTAVRT